MDLVNKVTGGGSSDTKENEGGSSGGGGFLDKLNAKAGGGKESEKDEDYLDKGNALGSSLQPPLSLPCAVISDVRG